MRKNIGIGLIIGTLVGAVGFFAEVPIAFTAVVTVLLTTGALLAFGERE
jgi:hypothetical protein